MKKKIKIIIRNHRCQIADYQLALQMRENKRFKIRVPGAYFAMQNNRNGWDGYKRYITENGTFDTGLLEDVLDFLKEEKVKVELVDKRNLFKEIGLVHEVAGIKGRHYQVEAIKAIVEGRLAGLRWQRGILYEATNAGKTLIAAMLVSSFASKRRGIFLINNQVIFNQLVEELRELLGSDVVGYVSSKKTDWKRFNICMVQTLSNRIKGNPRIRADVQNTDIILVDEADEVIGYKTTQHILSVAYDAPIRVALTGSADTAKDKIKRKQVEQFFGRVVHKTTNKQMVEWGYSAKPHIEILEGNTTEGFDSYQEAYELGVMKSRERNKKVWKRVWSHLKQGRTSILILIRYRKHAKYLLKHIPEKIRDTYTIKAITGASKTREQVLKEFKEQRFEILICSMIIKRGKNLPRMQVLINASAGDSHTTIKQILGRGLRKEAGVKEEIYMDDFFDQGEYLKRHSKHRVSFYKKEGFPVKESYK